MGLDGGVRAGEPAGGGEGTNRAGDRTTRDHLRQNLQKPDLGDRSSVGNSGYDARYRLVSWLLPGDDLWDFLAAANLDNGNPETLLHSIRQFFKFLPGEQRQEFLAQVNQKAS